MALQELIYLPGNFSQLVQGLYIMIVHMNLNLAHFEIIHKALKSYLQKDFNSPFFWAEFWFWAVAGTVMVHAYEDLCMHRYVDIVVCI
jgi:small basic protein